MTKVENTNGHNNTGSQSAGASQIISSKNASGIKISAADKQAGTSNAKISQETLKFFNSMAWGKKKV